MDTKLIDDRLRAVVSAEEFERLQARADRAYARLQAGAPAGMLADLAALVAVMREVETKLLDERQGKRDTDWAQGTMATLA